MDVPKSGRVNLSGAGSYISISGAMGNFDESLKHVFKMGYVVNSKDEIASPTEMETSFLSDHFVLDFKGLLAEGLDVDKIIQDCDFVKKIVSNYPDETKQLVLAFTSSPTGFEEASAIAEKIGFTEEASVKAGGGVAWIAVLVAVAVLARACDNAGKGNPQGKPRQ